MPAAQHADDSPAPPGRPDGPDADIIDFTTRRQRPNPGSPLSSWRPTTMPATEDDAHPPVSAEEQAMYEDVAGLLEQRFQNVQETLTDERTASLFKASLTVVEGFLEGAHAQDIINDDQHDKLATMMRDLRTATDYV